MQTSAWLTFRLCSGRWHGYGGSRPVRSTFRGSTGGVYCTVCPGVACASVVPPRATVMRSLLMAWREWYGDNATCAERSFPPWSLPAACRHSFRFCGRPVPIGGVLRLVPRQLASRCARHQMPAPGHVNHLTELFVPSPPLHITPLVLSLMPAGGCGTVPFISAERP